MSFKIDLLKWKTAVKRALDEREEKRANTEKKYWSALDYYFDERLTKLYSIRAHSRDRIHRKFARLDQTTWNRLGHKETSYKEFTEANGAIRFELTLEDQAKYLGDSWKEYERLIVKWDGKEEGPKCFCGMPTGVILDETGNAHLMCIFHTKGEGAMFPLPEEKPENWPEVSREQLNIIMAKGMAEAEKREDDE